MMYSKGDTVETKGTIMLVLDDGLPGKEFSKQHLNQEMYYLDDEGSYFKVRVNSGFEWALEDSYQQGSKETVWYNLLVGDVNCWTEERNLYAIKENQCSITKET